MNKKKLTRTAAFSALGLALFPRRIYFVKHSHAPVFSQRKRREENQITQEIKGMQKATFGAGCFWGVEAAFRQVKGVISTSVGYTGGSLKNPTYEDVCSGKTGHAEVVEVVYDPEQVSYDKLLQVFWENHDPTTLNRQGPDIGAQYRSAVFYHTPEQMTAALAAKEKLQTGGRYKRPIVTEITAASPYYPAEDYHQQYLEKRGLASCHI